VARKHLDRAKIAQLHAAGYSQRQIAKELGCAQSAVCGVLRPLTSAEAHAAAPDGFHVRGVSTLYDSDGNVRGQWVKTQKDREEQTAALLEAIKSAMADALPVGPIAAPAIEAANLLTVYPMGDPHIGMYAWAAETGADFDLEIAERNLTEAMVRLVMSSPPSSQALIVNVGDFFHADNTLNRTMRSGHALDVDTRWAKVLRIGIRAMRTCIEQALCKHTTVRVINEIGNHDDHTSQVLTLALQMAYEQNPRVSFDDSPAKFHYHVFGQNLIGVTHGDTVKPADLGGIMAADQRVAWGQTRHRYWYTGHVHNQRVFELHGGVLVESFRTLAAKDSWTASMGYRSGRDMCAIVLHREWGEVERHRVDISRVEAAA
jgi:hypothetical protein